MRGENGLLDRLCKRDPRSQREFMDYRFQDLVDYLRRQFQFDHDDAEEVAADVLYQVLTSIDLYDPRRGTFDGWLMSIARHKAIDRIRRMKRRPDEVELHDGDGVEAAVQEADSETACGATAVVLAIFRQLPEKQQEILILASTEWTSASIGESVGMSSMAVRQALSRARKAICDRAAKLLPTLDEPDRSRLAELIALRRARGTNGSGAGGDAGDGA